MLTDYANRHPEDAEAIVALLRDEDPMVRRAAVAGLLRFPPDILKKYIPDFQQMLKDKNPGVQSSGLEMLERLRVEIPREDLLPFLQSSDWRVLNLAYSQLREQDGKISNDDALILLQNPEPVARLLGLTALSQNPEKDSVELALPLLRDPDEMARLKAAQTLRVLTGQHFTEDQTDQWMKWWTENKTNLSVQLHPEELRPHFEAPTDGR